MLVADLKRSIREIPDFPKEGINFYDVSTLFRDPDGLRSAVDRLVERYRGVKIDALVGIEARGLVVGAAMAYQLGIGLVLARKPGKLPADIVGEDYDLEYGQARIEVHTDAIAAGDRVVIVDDLLATGGTAAATGKLMERLGARVDGFAFMVELKGLNGRKSLGSSNVFSLIQYD